MNLFKVLENRNACLKKIADHSDDFFNQINEEKDKGLKCLPAFEIWRKNAFKTLELYDNYINSLASQITPSEKNETFKASLTNLLEINKKLIYYINTIDMKIIERIEIEKANLLKMLAAAEQSKKTVSKFRSQVVPKSGCQLDGKI